MFRCVSILPVLLNPLPPRPAFSRLAHMHTLACNAPTQDNKFPTGGTSHFCTRLPPPLEVGRRPPRGGGGGLAAEEGFSGGLASRRGGGVGGVRGLAKV